MTHDPREPFVYHFQSASEPDVMHRVEIDALGFWGDCSCKAHDAQNGQVKGALTKHQRAEHKIGKPSETWCWHIRRARKAHVMAQIEAAAAKAYDAAIEAIKPVMKK